MAKPAPEINTEELERRLRAVDSEAAEAEDPLAELTRLIETFDTPAKPAGAVVDLAARRAAGVGPRGQGGGAMNTEPHWGAPNEREAEETISSDLRGALGSAPSPESFDEFAFGPEQEIDAEAPYAAESSGPGESGSPARRGFVVKTAALLSVGVFCIGGYFWYKGALPGLPKAPPVILASTAPVKVLPPTQDTIETADNSDAILRNGHETPSTPVKILSSEEQPVDVRVQVADTSTLNGALATAPAAGVSSPTLTQDSNPPTPQAEVSPTPLQVTRGLTAIVPDASGGASAVPVPNPPTPQLIEPKKPRTVIVRPDGTLVADASQDSSGPDSFAAQPTAPAPTTPPSAAAPGDSAPLASTPKVDLPPKSSAKTATRALPTKLASPAASNDAPNAPLQLGPSADKIKKSGRPIATASLDTAPVVSQTQAASTADAAQSTTGQGSWAVQLAAPRSESEANGVVDRAKSQYSEALSGAPIAVHKADVNGETVYRVRIGGLSKDAAAAMCAKIHSAGGACFIARN